MIRPETQQYSDLVKSCQAIIKLLERKQVAITQQIKAISNRPIGNQEQKGRNEERLSDLYIKLSKVKTNIAVKEVTLKELKKRANDQEQMLNKYLEEAEANLPIMLHNLQNHAIPEPHQQQKTLILNEDHNNMNDYDYVLFYLKVKEFVNMTRR